MKKQYLLLFLAVGFFSPIFGQNIRNVAPSPLGKWSQVVGLTDISMEYSRPGVKGRKIFGSGDDYLLQYGEIWRTGANNSTQISFSNDVMVNGKEVPKGTYAIYTVPGENEWKFMLYTDTSLGGGTANYDKSKELASFDITPKKLDSKVETLTFGLNNITNTSATLHLTWENTQLSLDINTKTDDMMMAQIDNAMKNPMASAGNMYSTAANYYYNNGKDINKALEWISKACEINNSIFDYRTKAYIQAKLGKYKEAVATIDQLHKAAETATGFAKTDYDDNIKAEMEGKAAEWKKKK